MPIEGAITDLGGVPTGGNSAGGGVPKLVEGAKLAFVMALRSMFSSELTNANIRYSKNKETTKLKIFTAHPTKIEFYPCLIVSVASGDCSFKYLQDDLVSQNLQKSEYLYAGQLWFNIAITIMTNTTVDREKLIDHLIFYLRHVAVGTIRSFNILYGKGMRLGPENIIEVENKPVYEQTLDIPCYLEYRSTVSQELMQTLRRIGTDLTVDLGDEE